MQWSKPKTNPSCVNAEEIATREMLVKDARARRSTKEYARPFFDHMREYINDAKGKSPVRGTWKPKTIGKQPGGTPQC